MTCIRCGRQLRPGEMFCLNCGEPTLSSVDPRVREKPSDIVTCLVIGLFVIFGIPALLFGGYLLALGTGFITPNKPLAGNGLPAMLVSVIPLGVFVALLAILIRVGMANRRGA